MARNRRQSWCLEENKDGSWNLTRGNRPVVNRILSKGLAMRHLSARHQPGDRVYEVEPDGYRTEVTKQLIKSGTIGARGAVPVGQLQKR